MPKVVSIESAPGKTYITRNGDLVRIEAETNYGRTYKMQGIDDQGRVTWRSRAGRFTSHPHHLDLVALAPGTARQPPAGETR